MKDVAVTVPRRTRIERIDAGALISPESIRIENVRDRAVRRWGGVAILVAALLIAGAAIAVSPDQSRSADRAWNLLFVLVGYAGAYLFRRGGGAD
jgi:hypothetical protein